MAPSRAMHTVSAEPSRVSASESADVPATKSHIKVVVRVRPENQAEREGGFALAVKPLDEHVLVFDPKEQQSPEYFHGRKRKGRDFLKKKNRDLRYAFDRVFDENTPNFEIYENTTKCILDGLLDGYNCSVFAYGATGAGKTFTMLGTQQNPGVIFHTMMDLYQRIEDIKQEKTCQVAVSYLEVYNEQIRDLLVPSSFLPIREDPQRGCIIAGLSLHKPGSAEELLHMLEFGNRNRTQHPTDANAESSRSHAVFQVFVKQQDRTANLSADVRVAKMSLIDLAGSERATVTKNCGARFREGANINRSLLALGNCINALAEGKGKSMHIPYRNSKLTRLLKDSLGGNCRTVMIAAVSPSTHTYEDTHNTLKYANRAKNIKATLKRNVVSVDFHVTKYAKIVDELRTEVSELKIKLRQYEEGSVVPTPRHMGAHSVTNAPQDHEVQRLRGVLNSVFTERKTLRHNILEIESNERDLSFKISRKQLCLSRFDHFFQEAPVPVKAQLKLENEIDKFQSRRGNLTSQKAVIESKMIDNRDWLNRVESEMTLAGKENQIPEVLEMALRMHHLEMDIREKKQEIWHLRKMARSQDRELQNNEKLITTLLQTARKQFYILKGHGFATSDVKQDFDKLQQDLTGGHKVAWADQSMAEVSTDDKAAPSIDSLMRLPLLTCVNTTPKTPQNRPCRRTPRKSPHNPSTPVSVRSFPTPLREAKAIINPIGGSPVLRSPPTSHSINQKDTPHVNKTETKLNTAKLVTQTIEGASDRAEMFRDDQTVTLSCSSVHIGNTSVSCNDMQQASTSYHCVQTVAPPVNGTNNQTRNCNDNNSVPQRTINTKVSREVKVHPPVTGHSQPSSDQNFHRPLKNDSINVDFEQSKCSLNETFSLSSAIPVTEQDCVDHLENGKRGSSSATVTKPKRSSLSGSATVTKTHSDVSAICCQEKKPPENFAVKRVARSMDFSSPEGLMSYADAVKSPGNSSGRKPLQNVTNSPLAIPLDFSEDDDRGRKHNRKVAILSHPHQQENYSSHGNHHLTMAGQAQVTSFHNRRNHSFRPSNPNIFHGKKASRTVTPPGCEQGMSTNNRENIRKLEKFGLPSMTKQPNYMKATASVSYRNQHGRSKSSSNLQQLRHVTSVPPSRMMSGGSEIKPLGRTGNFSRSKSSAQLNSRPAWNR